MDSFENYIKLVDKENKIKLSEDDEILKVRNSKKKVR